MSPTKKSEYEGKNLIENYSWFNDPAVMDNFLLAVNEIADKLPREINILGIGSGVGNLDYAVKKYLETSCNKIVKLTITDRYTNDTTKNDGVDVISVENKNLPFPDNSFDLVIARSVTHYEETKEEEIEVLKEVKRVLKTNGLYLTEYPYFSNKDEVELLKEIHSLVSKYMDLKTYDEFISVHEEVFSETFLTTTQPDLPLFTEKKNFNQRYKASNNSLINSNIIKLIKNYPKESIPNVWADGDDFGWEVDYAILACKK